MPYRQRGETHWIKELKKHFRTVQLIEKTVLATGWKVYCVKTERFEMSGNTAKEAYARAYQKAKNIGVIKVPPSLKGKTG
ncbi:MAG: hypothetical protein ACKVRP_02385 [Bacteroidota bacterium]